MLKYGETPGPMILAHRGGGGDQPEHTPQAFYHAVKAGCEYLELDVLPDEQGRLLVRHGPTEDPINTPIELKGILARHRDKYFAIDPKVGAAVEPLVRFVVDEGITDQICIGASVDSRAVKVADAIELETGRRPATALVSAHATAWALLGYPRLLTPKAAAQASFIHVYDKLVSRRVVEGAHRNRLKIISWTVNNPERMQQLVEWGTDGFMTDYPSLAKKTGLLQPVKS